MPGNGITNKYTNSRNNHIRLTRKLPEYFDNTTGFLFLNHTIFKITNAADFYGPLLAVTTEFEKIPCHRKNPASANHCCKIYLSPYGLGNIFS